MSHMSERLLRNNELSDQGVRYGEKAFWELKSDLEQVSGRRLKASQIHPQRAVAFVVMMARRDRQPARWSRFLTISDSADLWDISTFRQLPKLAFATGYCYRRLRRARGLEENGLSAASIVTPTLNTQPSDDWLWFVQAGLLRLREGYLMHARVGRKIFGREENVRETYPRLVEAFEETYEA